MGANQSVDFVGGLAGPPLGAALFNLNVLLPFLGDAVSYLASVGSLLLIRTPFQAERIATRPLRHLWRDIGAGLRWIWQKPPVRFFTSINAILNFVNGGSFLVIIVRVKELLPPAERGSLPLASAIILATISVGGVIGSLLVEPVKARVPFRTFVIVSVWYSAVMWQAQAIAPNIWWLGAITAVTAITLPIYNALIVGYRLALIPDDLLGRVNSAIRMISYALIPLGAFVTGTLLERYGAITVILSYGLIYIGASIWIALTPALRHVL